jgi:hypothetical protein
MLIITDNGTKQKWKMVFEAIAREMNMTSETLEIKRNFSVNNYNSLIA